jgi:hypothetical protein
MINKVIFLDVDGVLNSKINMKIRRENGESTSSYYVKIPGDKIYKLKRIVDNTDAAIVLSSSWRIGYSRSSMTPSPAFMNLVNQLEPYGLHIYDWTPLDKNRNRGYEIHKWLYGYKYANGYFPNYIILDDNIADLIPLHRGHIIKVNSLLGLQNEHVNIAVNILNSFQ